MKWKGKLINYIIEQLKDDEQWENVLGRILIDYSIGIHLAIFNEPFLSLIYDGSKTIESRFSRNKISPLGKIKKGDIVLLKESGGFINGIFIAGNIRFYSNLNSKSKAEVESLYGERICTSYDKNFWESHAESKYATLIEIEKIKKTTPFKCNKSDRRGWSIVREGISDSLFMQKELKRNSIITLSGRISSGKSYVAQIIQKDFSLPIASFGSYLKEICKNNNLPTERQTLQEIGELLIRTNPRQFLTEVISYFANCNNELILDGVRHRVILEQVKSLTENHIAIFIDADLKTRYERYVNRNKDSDLLKTFEQFKISDSHPVEMEIESLKEFCDYVVHSEKDNYSSELFDFLINHGISQL